MVREGPSGALASHLYVDHRNNAYLQYNGVPEEKLFFTPHFVDNTFFVNGRRKPRLKGNLWKSALSLDSTRCVRLSVRGKDDLKKRPADFVQACLNILGSPEGSNIHALFVGDGPLRPFLEHLAKPYAGRIHFAGFANQTQLRAFYEASNALVVPLDGRETWGLVVNEAASCGIPAVVSDAAGCAPDMIDEGRTGYTYPVGDVEALARRMLELKLACEQEPTAIRQALAEKMACHSIERATEGLESALTAVTTK